MTPDEAARILRERFRHAAWLTAVGVSEMNGQTVLVLHTEDLDRVDPKLRNARWLGYPLDVREFPPRVRPKQPAHRTSD
jgi:hypothetical protein